MVEPKVGKFVEYYEHILAHFYWYQYEFARWIELILCEYIQIVTGFMNK